MSEMVKRVARAIDAVQLFVRFNDWASGKVDGLPIEICRYGNDGEDEIVVLKRFPDSEDQSEVLREAVSEFRARAAIEAMREPTKEMVEIGYTEINNNIDSWNYESDSGYAVEDIAPTATWRAMIDAAFKP